MKPHLLARAEADPFRRRLALTDRIMLALVIYSMALALYSIWQWGILLASMRFLFDAIGFGIVTALLIVPALLVMVLVERTRRLAGAGLVCASYVVGFSVWCASLFVAWEYAGSVATLVGVAVAGIGVIAVAVAAMVVNGSWLAALGISAAAGVVLALRRFGLAVVR